MGGDDHPHQSQIDYYSSETFAIAQIADDEVSYDREEVDEEEFLSEDDYLPAVWAKAERHWNGRSQSKQSTILLENRISAMSSYGVLGEDSRDELIRSLTFDHQMIRRIAAEVSLDKSWKASVGLTEAQISAHHLNAVEAVGSENTQYLPVIWEEATRR